MAKMSIALQVFSIRNEAGADFEGTMRRVKQMGYDGVELAGLYDIGSAVACKSILDRVGLELVSAHVPIEELENDEQLDDYVKTGVKFLVIPFMRAISSEEELKINMERIRKVGERCKARGVQLLYHNHASEFEKINGKYILDTYYEEIPSDLLNPELDTCWVNVGGEDPAAYLRKYSGRISIVHLKDFTGYRSEKTFAYVKNGAHPEDLEQKMELRPVGYGYQDVPEILAASEEAGASWIIVEQDRPSMEKTPLECAEMSVNYLKKIMK